MTTCRPLFPDILSLNGRWLARKPALVLPDRAFTFAELNAEANRVAHGLIAAGCASGERVGVVMDNSAEMLTILFGAMKAGAVAVPLNTSITDEAVNALLADAGITALVASSAHLTRFDEATLKACRIRLAHAELAPAGWTALNAWRDAQIPEDPGPLVGPDDVCNIIYSSGTTGQPKGITHTHGQRFDWAHDLSLALRYDSSARTLIATGLYSNITWVSLLCTTLVGGTLVLLNRFDPDSVLETIERERTTHTSMVPVQYQRLLDHPDFPQRDTRSMRAMMCCGSPLPERVKAELFKQFPNALIELYGTTEGAVTTLAPEEAEGRIASVGKPVPGGDLLILDDGDVPAPTGEPGEIVALNRFVMAGYWNRPDATAEALWTAPDGRRWLRTGDIGRLDDEGFLTITDRKKDVIISGGQNIYPADLEAVLMGHQAVQECAVIGIPDDRWGEAPLALVVAMPDAAVSETDLLGWTNARLGRQQRLSALEFRQDLPRNANGKVLKRELRQLYRPQTDGGVAA